MREPDKFAVLVALAYAYGFGWGIAWLTNRSRQKVAQIAAAALAIALPLVYTPNLLGGLGGQVMASELPSSWSIASRIAGQDTVLFLPWHEYFPTPFTDQRVIANPAALYFAGTVLPARIPALVTALPPRTPSTSSSTRCSDRQLTCNGRVSHSPPRRRFVALAKVADWRDFAQVGDAPGIRSRTQTPHSTSSLSRRPPRRHTTTSGSVSLTSLITGSFPVLQVLSPSPFPSRKAGHSTAIRPYGSPTGKWVSSRQQEEVAHYGPSSGVLAGEIGSLAAALAVAGIAFFERRRRGSGSVLTVGVLGGAARSAR